LGKKGDAGSDVIAGPTCQREEEEGHTDLVETPWWAMGRFPAWARVLPHSPFLFFFVSFLCFKRSFCKQTPNWFKPIQKLVKFWERF
jgi:hypothetical protein